MLKILTIKLVFLVKGIITYKDSSIKFPNDSCDNKFFCKFLTEK